MHNLTTPYIIFHGQKSATGTYGVTYGSPSCVIEMLRRKLNMKEIPEHPRRDQFHGKKTGTTKVAPR